GDRPGRGRGADQPGGPRAGRAWRGARGRATRARQQGPTWRGIVREPPTAGKRPATSLGCNPMASIPAPASLPGPLSWWHNPEIRRRVIAGAVLASAYGFGLAYGAWT